jgi:hypothetical protein
MPPCQRHRQSRFGPPPDGTFFLATLVGGFFHFKPSEQCLLVADIVAKRFFAYRRAILIQKLDLPRKIDSSGVPVGFESCALGGGR